MRNCKGYLDYVRSIDRDEWAGYACQAKERATTLLGFLMEKVRGFSVLDFAIFKICLLTFGLWLGATCSRLFGKIKVFLFASFLATWCYLIWRIFFTDDD